MHARVMGDSKLPLHVSEWVKHVKTCTGAQKSPKDLRWMMVNDQLITAD